jgi:hypothetical protein
LQLKICKALKNSLVFAVESVFEIHYSTEGPEVKRLLNSFYPQAIRLLTS